MFDKFFRFIANLGVVLIWTLLFLPFVIVLSRIITLSLHFIKASNDYKIWGIDFDRNEDVGLVILMMIYVSLVCLMSAQMLVWSSLTESNESKAALKGQLKEKLENIIEERKSVLSKLNKK